MDAWNMLRNLIPDPSDPRSRAAQNRKGPFPGDEMDNNILVVDRILEPQTIAHFAEACMWNSLPNGQAFSQPCLNEDAVVLLSTPYSEWAPQPYNQIQGSAIEKVMTRIGSTEDSDRLTVIPQPLAHLKSRLWEGIIPITHNRWQAMQLDDRKHHRMSCEHLGSVLSVFEYLNQAPVKENLRTTFNVISEHLQEFEQAINAKSTAEGKQIVSVTGLWAEFIAAHYQVVVIKAHAWVTEHTTQAFDRLIQALRTTPEYGEEALDLTNKFDDFMQIATKADCMIFLPMTGYKGYIESSNDEVKPPLYRDEQQDRRDAYTKHMKKLGRDKMFANLLNPDTREASMALVNRCIEQKEAHEESRIDMRGQAPSVPVEPWIRSIAKAHESDAISLVTYRLTYRHSDSEWNQFREKLDADMSNWGDGVQGMDAIKPMVKLHWIDGRDHGITESDVDAARVHHNTRLEASELPKGSISGIFLVIDEECVSSYLDPEAPSSQSCPGTGTGFVIVADAHFDAEEPDDHEEESPGYMGSMKILGSLIWSDLVAMDEAQTQGPRELWPAALEHPDLVYVGPVVQWMRNRWAGLV